MLDTLIIILILLLGFLLAAALSPFEALGWWAGWFGREREDIAQTASPNTVISEAKHFVIFLTGIHSVSEDTFARREIALLEALRQRLPEATVLEIFPYSVDNRALTGQRFFAWFWRLALKLKLSRLTFAGFIINMRNVFQVAVSADHRYGPIYNQGTAETMLRALKKHGYLVGSGTPVTLIGYSGGGQVALGAGKYLKEIIRAPVRVISLGGIMASDPGLLELDGVYHLLGRHDRVARLGPILFPARLPILPYSSWNQGKASGLIQIIDMGPVDHTGRDGYLDANKILPDGRSAFEQTVDTIAALIRRPALTAQAADN
jgi:pimeloyl-ACP methyl ester carboxylesterase